MTASKMLENIAQALTCRSYNSTKGQMVRQFLFKLKERDEYLSHDSILQRKIFGDQFSIITATTITTLLKAIHIQEYFFSIFDSSSHILNALYLRIMVVLILRLFIELLKTADS
uniref:Uncharacterized protein n=1 Tax=Glossina austeni TaxID=7395 RepID=A0A1A9USY6_GLOAU